MTRVNKVIVVCGAALGLTCGFGPMFFSVVGIFLKPMAMSFHWGRSDVAILPMLAMTGTAVGAPIVGLIADRIGWRKVIAYAIFLFSLSLVALAMAPASRAYVGIAGFAIGLTGAATTAAGYLAVLPRVFDARLGMALGFGMIGTGIGGFIAPIAANRLGAITDWRHAYMVFAIVALTLGFLAHQLIFRNLPKSAPVSANSQVSDDGEAMQGEAGMLLSEAFVGYRFWLIAVAVFLVSSVILGGFVHLAAFVSDKGLSTEVAARAAAVVGLGLAVARVGLGVLLDRVFAPLVAMVAFAMGALGFLIFVTDAVQVPTFLLLGALLLGIATGSEGDLIPYLTRKYFGKRAIGAIYGSLFGAATIGGAVGPYLYGLAFDHFGSYTPIHQISGIACVVCAVAILFLGRYPRSFSGVGNV
ncbi:Predicted arabinose efflux permease, MFS family [Burkholderia sp. D7]|nr:Predicted arabinose efflux permease, MFS family [Burkholderia sp. D7]